MAKRKKTFTVSDGELMLTLEPAPEGGYTVTSPMDPEILTQGDSIEECFAMAYDLRNLLRKVRAQAG